MRLSLKASNWREKRLTIFAPYCKKHLPSPFLLLSPIPLLLHPANVDISPAESIIGYRTKTLSQIPANWRFRNLSFSFDSYCKTLWFFCIAHTLYFFCGRFLGYMSRIYQAHSLILTQSRSESSPSKTVSLPALLPAYKVPLYFKKNLAGLITYRVGERCHPRYVRKTFENF